MHAFYFFQEKIYVSTFWFQKLNWNLFFLLMRSLTLFHVWPHASFTLIQKPRNMHWIELSWQLHLSSRLRHFLKQGRFKSHTTAAIWLGWWWLILGLMITTSSHTQRPRLSPFHFVQHATVPVCFCQSDNKDSWISSTEKITMGVAGQSCWFELMDNLGVQVSSD